MIVPLCLLTLIALAIPCSAQEAAENLLKTPGFEQGEDDPTGWSFNHRRTDGEIAWDRNRAHAGAASVRITNHNERQTGNVLQTVHLDPPLKPGSRVTFSAFAASEDAGGSGPTIIFNLLSTSNVRQDASASCPGGTHDFVEVRGETIAERPTNRLIIYLCHYGTGTVWWDDATVTIERAKPTRIIPRPEEARTMPTLTTDDGLALILADSGAVNAILLDGKSLGGQGSQSGLWLRPFGGDTVPVTGEITSEGDAIVQHFQDDQFGLRVDATFSSEGGVIKCTGAVEDLTGEDRSLDLLFSLPVGGNGWRWGQSIREQVPLGEEPQALAVTTFSSLSDPQAGEGIALAVPAGSPCDCEFTWDADFGYAIRFRFGLSPAAGGELKSRAPFAFVVYRCDGRWGLRDAARRYYELYSWAFEKRAEREGLWMFGAPRFELPDPDNYAFHEGGPGGWEFDDEHDIYTCPYIIPGQREVTRLDKLPDSKQEAMELFRAWETPKPDRPGGWGAQIKEIIESCMLHDADGLPQIRIRNTTWGGNSFTFPLNANPRLFEDGDKTTIAKALLAHVAEQHQEVPNLDGTYVDSLGAWGSYLNHRHEHFAYAQVPLTYDPANGKPVIHNRFTLLEFLWSLRDYLHERGKLLFANGVHQNRRFHFFALDIMGVEGHGYLEQKRVMAFQKPFLLLIYNIHDDPAEMERSYHLCTFYGIYPSFANMRVYETPEAYAPVAELNDRFVPVLRTVTGAGWQPITHARSSDPDVWLERWGPDERGTVYLTVYNSAEDERSVTLTVQAADLGLEGATLTLEDQLSGGAWEAAIEDAIASVEVPVPAQQVRLLRLSAH